MRQEFENPQALSENRLPARSIILPAQKSGVFYINKTDSDRIKLLNGEWKFFWTEDEESLPKEFYSASFDDTAWNNLPVPSEWQFHGYGQARYTNVDYAFPFNPPYVGYDNPVGIYRRHFMLDSKNRDVILHFDGVDGAFNVFVNGKYIGFSKGSRVPAEFDITHALNFNGDNVLTVQIYTWSDAQYLENQDMWLANGIIRDVYLIYQNKLCLWDYEISTTIDSVSVTLYPNRLNTSLHAVVSIGRVTQKVNFYKETTVYLDIPSPRSWNAEDPYLYDLEISISQNDMVSEVYSKKIGLRESARINGLICVNKTPIVFLGANRHEYRPNKGRAISVEDIREDLQILKDFNFNAIRTSHYPQHPAFYELCNKMGFYIVDEADLETHGCEDSGDQGWLSKDPAWRGAYLDRVERMYMRDRNETCIIVWSIGNECGNGENLVACADWLNAQKNVKPILQAQDVAEHPQYTDFRQYGYPSMAEVRAFNEFKSDFPAISTEYGHAMGNSPGSLHEIWDVIDENPHMQGGFIWEFRSHGFEKILRDGTKTYLYGGDFDEGPNWANFVIDGYCFSDGRPKPSLYEIQYLMSPLRIRDKNGELSIKSHNSFVTLHCSMLWNVTEDTAVIASGKQEDLLFFPNTTVTMPYPADLPESRKSGAEYRLNVRLVSGKHKLGCAQVLLGSEPKRNRLIINSKAEALVREEGKHIIVQMGKNTIKFCHGMLSYLEADGCVLLNAPMDMSFYRVNTDNDGIIRGILKRHLRDVWDGLHLDKMFFQEEAHRVEKLNSVVVLTFVGKIVTEGRYLGFSTEITYTIHADGTILTQINGEPYGRWPDRLPRIGVAFSTSKALDLVSWYGRGWLENYPDRKSCTPIGKYEGTAAQMSVHYDRPQDNGCRCDTRYLALTNKQGNGLLFCGIPQFSFEVHDYTIDALRNANHPHELIKDDTYNHVYIDYAMRGLGSYSCGPEPEEEYELHAHSFTFAFTVSPYRGEADAISHVRTNWGTQSVSRSPAYVIKKNPNASRENFDCRVE